MIRSRLLLAVGLGLVALLALTPLANAKGKAKGPKGPAPDLVVAKLSKPAASLVAGARLKVTVQVRNKGAAKAGKSRVAVYLAKGKKHVKRDRRLGRRGVRSLKPGKKATAKLNLVLPKGTAAGSYRLIACADDGRRVREARERGNCAVSRKFQLQPPAPPAPAFSMTDGVDWGFAIREDGTDPLPGEPLTLTLRAANGLAGQAGYTQANVAPAPFLNGTTTTLNYGNLVDDGAVAVDLPFAFPFGGVNEQRVSVSTNGWVSFGALAIDYWDDTQNDDYRGVPAVVGEHERGLMPYWADLTLEDSGAGPGTVREVVAADGSAVAFQWEIDQLSGGAPRRVFQVVLFRDGSFRFDYPGANAAGGRKSFIGYSTGTGPGSAGIVSVEDSAVPGSSILFTPKPVSAAGALPAGQATATLPAGSQFVSGSPGCVVTVAPSAFVAGLASCPVPPLASGQQASQSVTFSMPPLAPGQIRPANFRLLGSYLAAGVSLRDGDEINGLSNSLAPTAIDLVARFGSPELPRTDGTTRFVVEMGALSSGGFDEPTATFALPAATSFEGVFIGEDAVPCDTPANGTVSCRLPSGGESFELLVELVPRAGAVGAPLTLGITGDALNAEPATVTASSPPVLPRP